MVTPRLSVPSQTNMVIASARRTDVAVLAADRVTDIAQVPWVVWRGAACCALSAPADSPSAGAGRPGVVHRTCRASAYPAALGRGRTGVTLGQSVVTRFISARLVTPCFTFHNADLRRSRTPARSAASAMAMALPPAS